MGYFDYYVYRDQSDEGRAACRCAKTCTIHPGSPPDAIPNLFARRGRTGEQYHDDVRYATLALAIERIARDRIAGAFAEIGVYRGLTSSFIHRQAPDRQLFLFDTFEGFPDQDLEDGSDTRFKDTSQQGVMNLIGDARNLVFRKGYFPETAVGLEDERFALVMLDVDLYAPALEVFRFFYPRLERGGYFFLHDFNSPESNHGISRAAMEFMSDKPELLIEIPDFHGSALFRKLG